MRGEERSLFFGDSRDRLKEGKAREGKGRGEIEAEWTST